VAHWVKRHRESPAKLERFRRLTVERTREAAHRFDRTDYLADMPSPLPRDQRAALDQEFAGKQHWTGRSMDELVGEVADEWPDPVDQRLLWQIYVFGYAAASHVVHHGHVAVAGVDEQQEDKRTFNLGPSPLWVRDALAAAYFSYANTISLVIDPAGLDKFARLYGKNLGPFVKVTMPGDDGKPLESSGGER